MKLKFNKRKIVLYTFLSLFLLFVSIIIFYSIFSLKYSHIVIGKEILNHTYRLEALGSFENINFDSVLTILKLREKNETIGKSYYTPFELRCYKLPDYLLLIKVMSDAQGFFTSDEQYRDYKIILEFINSSNKLKKTSIRIINEEYVLIFQKNKSIIIITNKLEKNFKFISWIVYNSGMGHGGKWFLDNTLDYNKITIDSNFIQKKEPININEVKQLLKEHGFE